MELEEWERERERETDRVDWWYFVTKLNSHTHTHWLWEKRVHIIWKRRKSFLSVTNSSLSFHLYGFLREKAFFFVERQPAIQRLTTMRVTFKIKRRNSQKEAHLSWTTSTTRTYIFFVYIYRCSTCGRDEHSKKWVSPCVVGNKCSSKEDWLARRSSVLFYLEMSTFQKLSSSGKESEGTERWGSSTTFWGLFSVILTLPHTSSH